MTRYRIRDLLWRTSICLAIAILTISPPHEDALCGAEIAGNIRQSNRIIDVSEVERGMCGYGLTVFEGTKIEKFRFEVVGIVRSWAPKGRVILVRLEHPRLEKTGVIAGMSGSPLYLDGRLLGAVAYGFPFTQVPLAGVTPASEMLVVADIAREADERDNRAKWRASLTDELESLGSGGDDLYRNAHRVREKILRLLLTVPGWGEESGDGNSYFDGRLSREVSFGGRTMAMVQSPIPLSIGGVGMGNYERIAPLMRLRGFELVQAGSTEASWPADVGLKAGMPIGVSLLSGDIDVAAMGTLTFIDDGRIVAFGHGMQGLGRTCLPLAIGNVQAVVPSTFASFRLTTTGEVVGSLVQDRQAGVVGCTETDAPVFPCRIRVKGVRDEEFNFKVAGHWQLAPELTFYAASLAALRWEEAARNSVRTSARIYLEGRERPVQMQNLYADTAPQQAAMEQILVPMKSLMLNPFQAVDISRVEMDFRVEDDISAARIVSARIDRTEVRPGEAVTIVIALRKFRGGQVERQITMEVPEDIKPGSEMHFQVCDASTMFLTTIFNDPGLFDPQSFEGLISALESLPQNSRLYVITSYTRLGVRYRGRPMPALPPSVTNMFVGGTEFGQTRPLVESLTEFVDTPWVVSGGADVAVRVSGF
jgi:hypothetical protein